MILLAAVTPAKPKHAWRSSNSIWGPERNPWNSYEIRKWQTKMHSVFELEVMKPMSSGCRDIYTSKGKLFSNTINRYHLPHGHTLSNHSNEMCWGFQSRFFTSRLQKHVLSSNLTVIFELTWDQFSNCAHSKLRVRSSTVLISTLFLDSFAVVIPARYMVQKFEDSNLPFLSPDEEMKAVVNPIPPGQYSFPNFLRTRAINFKRMFDEHNSLRQFWTALCNKGIIQRWCREICAFLLTAYPRQMDKQPIQNHLIRFTEF